jgi:hypothetical protein
VRRSTGDTTYSATIRLPLDRLTPTAAESTIQALRGVADPRNAERDAAAPRPDYYPPFAGFWLARDGSAALALRSVAPMRDVVILDAMGRPTTTVSIPRTLQIVQYDAGVLWALDRIGPRETLLRYRITR